MSCAYVAMCLMPEVTELPPFSLLKYIFIKELLFTISQCCVPFLSLVWLDAGLTLNAPSPVLPRVSADVKSWPLTGKAYRATANSRYLALSAPQYAVPPLKYKLPCMREASSFHCQTGLSEKRPNMQKPPF